VPLIKLLATLDDSSNIAPPGVLQEPSDMVSFIADNSQKQISTAAAIMLNATAAFSEAHWDTNPDEVHALLRDHSQQFLGTSKIVDCQLERWRFATPRTI